MQKKRWTCRWSVKNLLAISSSLLLSVEESESENYGSDTRRCFMLSFRDLIGALLLPSRRCASRFSKSNYFLFYHSFWISLFLIWSLIWYSFCPSRSRTNVFYFLDLFALILIGFNFCWYRWGSRVFCVDFGGVLLNL